MGQEGRACGREIRTPGLSPGCVFSNTLQGGTSVTPEPHSNYPQFLFLPLLFYLRKTTA